MPFSQEIFTLGVEEEYQIIDPHTRQLSSSALSILPQATRSLGEQVQPEMQLSQIEIATPICHTLADVRSSLQDLRRGVIEAARQQGKQIASAGAHPFSSWHEQKVTPKERYQGLAREYQQLTREQAIFGYHIHVGLHDREMALQVMNRARVWLAALLALSANSPFWMGDDTGYASFRTEMWSRWPTSGPPLLFSSLQEYQQLVHSFMATGALEDATKIYWDMRLSERFETVEFRVTDACTSIDEAVMLAGIARAIVRTCYEQAENDQAYAAVRPELLRMAHWHAARYGIADQLMDVEEQRPVSARALIEKMLTTVRPALEAEGDWEEVSSRVEHVLQHGNGAIRQRACYQQTGRLEAIVDDLVAETAKGTALKQ